MKAKSRLDHLQSDHIEKPLLSDPSLASIELVHLAGLSHVVTCGPSRQAGSPSQFTGHVIVRSLLGAKSTDMRILNWVQSKLGGGHEKKRVDDAGFTHRFYGE
ncbi:hypothetical protein QJS10_CPA06g02517 [Acorus calamus]|uniref:Uncharacterized protein n=1 Tax=Acorus calamus TaxID=4465 RepID=A0AAV9EIH4_ACOCL|nr:hypothetical protein QJS10_CPA06g02517 [Acorus calamus]